MCRNHSHVAVGYIEQTTLGPMRITIAQSVQDVKFEHGQVIAVVNCKPGVLCYIETDYGTPSLQAVQSFAMVLAAVIDEVKHEETDAEADALASVAADLGTDEQI